MRTPLRPSFVAAVLCSVLALGCRPTATQPPRPAPVAAPESWSFETQEARDEARDGALAAAHWLLTTHPPSAHAKTWIRARDYALDWIEADGEPQVVVNVPLVAWMSKDLRYRYGVYNRIAYQCGKAIYLANTANPDPMQAEVEGVRGALMLYDVFRQADKRARSKKLERLRRKLARGRLEDFIAKKFGLPPPPPEPSPPAKPPAEPEASEPDATADDADSVSGPSSAGDAEMNEVEDPEADPDHDGEAPDETDAADADG